MKVHVTGDTELRDSVRTALAANDGYCPCVLNSKGKQEYKCMCHAFIENTPVGESCHCGLYIKDEQ
jgi:ferredoxin-thioredoxin reductase catalytic subunit